MVKSMFIIPCCQRKNHGGERPIWDAIREKKLTNTFSFLDDSRERLIRFYSNLSENDAYRYYKNQQNRNIDDVWKMNLQIPSSPTMMAIDRYQGNLYSELDEQIKVGLRVGEIDNVLIVSALMGLIKPTDLIPNYNLMMSDVSPLNNRISSYWGNIFSDDKISEVKNFLEGYDYIYCLMSRSTGYIDSVYGLLVNFDNSYFVMSHCGSNSTRVWGKIINEAIQLSKQEPQKIRRISENYNSELLEMRHYKTSKHGKKTKYCKKTKSIDSEDISQINMVMPTFRKHGLTDDIRHYVCENIIKPARKKGLDEITVRAGDVEKAMGLSHRTPAVCSALKTKIDTICNVKIINIDGPPSGQGTNLKVTYRL